MAPYDKLAYKQFGYKKRLKQILLPKDACTQMSRNCGKINPLGNISLPSKTFQKYLYIFMESIIFACAEQPCIQEIVACSINQHITCGFWTIKTEVFPSACKLLALRLSMFISYE